MNKMITIILLAISIPAFSQDVYYTLTNPRDIAESGDTFHLIDVLTYSNEGFKLGSGQLYINYDTTVFGENVFHYSNLEILIPDNTILDQSVSIPPMEHNYYNDFITNDNTARRFSFSWQHDFSQACLDTFNIDYYSGVVIALKLKYKNGQVGNPTGICLEGGQNYSGQTYTACGPSDCNSIDCLNNPGVQLINDNYKCSDCLIVYSKLDAGQGSLREAILCASPNDTIRFASNLKMDTISINSSELVVDKFLNILSQPEIGITVSGSATDRVFNVLSGNEVLIEGLSMIGGSGAEGDCILNLGELTLENLTIKKGLGVSHLKNENNLNIRGMVRLIE